MQSEESVESPGARSIGAACLQLEVGPPVAVSLRFELSLFQVLPSPLIVPIQSHFLLKNKG